MLETGAGKGPPSLGGQEGHVYRRQLLPRVLALALALSHGWRCRPEVGPLSTCRQSAGLGCGMPEQASLSFAQAFHTHGALGPWPHSLQACSAPQEKLGLEGRKVRGKSLNWMSAKSV